ncbi:MAG TPA: histidine kinase [Pyrinomonadaceae bacterium]|nr:histidine kinase [Pyrinomonadaceae bacterium]
MQTFETSFLVNLVGFAIGLALYGLLGYMIIRHRKTVSRPVALRLIATALLGLIWNFSGFFFYFTAGHNQGFVIQLLLAAGYSSLGFLPSVVVLEASQGRKNPVVLMAFALSILATVLNFYAAFFTQTAPSPFAMLVLSFGALTLILLLVITRYHEALSSKITWISALLIFALSAFHLSANEKETNWPIELIAHQSSLPLVLAILIQNFRFAFADLFLKRAIALLLISLLAFGIYVEVLSNIGGNPALEQNPLFVSLLLAFWIITALIYPAIYKFAVVLVDKVVLKREDYISLLEEIGKRLDKAETESEVLQATREFLEKSVLAGKAEIIHSGDTVSSNDNDAVSLEIHTAEEPKWKIRLADFEAGRRLLSDDYQFLQNAASIAARRIDAIRILEERMERITRERELAELAAEAELKALRWQINPHFLFNALNTVGYLIQAGPERASSTLVKLTNLLRRVLSKQGEFTTLGDEISLITDYLGIEKERFEERLSVEIIIDRELLKWQIPPLIIQPLVENAMKHGISKLKKGGFVSITAEKYEDLLNKAILQKTFLRIRVSNSAERDEIQANKDGVGLKNVRDRLKLYYGENAKFTLQTENGVTCAELLLPADEKEPD